MGRDGDKPVPEGCMMVLDGGRRIGTPPFRERDSYDTIGYLLRYLRTYSLRDSHTLSDVMGFKNFRKNFFRLQGRKG